jgi:integral membrane protein
MNPAQRFKWTAYAEGASFLVLLAVAMPLKYLLGLPLAVRVVGLLHGVLFLLYIVLVFDGIGSGRFNAKTAALAMLASLLPFGPFLFERKYGATESAV